MINDHGKLALLLVALIGGFAMIIVGMVQHDSGSVTAGVGIVMAVVGYATGNGVLARTGNAPSPVYAPKPETIAAKNAAANAANADANADDAEAQQ